MIIALAGNPNCGKTTLFNALTGSSQYVGNWPGVTVEKKEGKLKGNKSVSIMDLPGIYSLSPYTLEEVVTRDYLIDEKPDVILNIVDASNLERNLYLTTQLLETGIPVVVALNMMDMVEKNGDKIDAGKLSKRLGVPVYTISALKETGIKEVTDAAVKAAGSKVTVPNHFTGEAANALSGIEDVLTGAVSSETVRWYAVKLFERDEKIQVKLNLTAEQKAKINAIIDACEDAEDDDSESIITNGRYAYIAEVLSGIFAKKRKTTELSTSDKIDQIVTNRILALPIFAAVMWVTYYVSIQTVGDWTIGWVEEFFGWIGGGIEGFLVSIGAADWLMSLVIDGIIGGLTSIFVFVPQMMILFFFLSLMEDCGYMARVAFIFDRIFRKFGLSGKSFIPMLIGTGCGVPAIMATRTIENEKDRRMTIMTTTFIPCGAKLPIIALIAGALFPESSWVAPSAYFIGMAAIIFSCLFLKRLKPFQGDPAPFVMELPPYHMPSFKGVCIHMWERGKAFIKKAGTVIFVACTIIWFLQSFNFGLELVEDTADSMLAVVAGFFAPVFAPLGFGTWEATAACLTGLVAKEVVVATLGIAYAIGEVAEDDPTLLAALPQYFTMASAYAFMVFNLLCAPCFAAIGAIRREMNSAKWTLATIAYQCTFAWVVAFLIYQIGTMMGF
ncbi:MAG: ferrous iron transport protein B [Peptococcaceae bacterium]|nr:ferrous iron transport protein B [Peptococcaceae bacterium]